jgi:phosphoribosyl-ATP pyrophosphohydrolase
MSGSAFTLKCGSVFHHFIHFCPPLADWEGRYLVPAARRTASRPLDKLERTIADRAKNPREKSYTSKLLAGGVEKIGAKVIEEAAEVVEAAGETGQAGREHFVREVADLVYHLLVLMKHVDCSLADLEAELSRRFGVSGIEEKASREKKPTKVKKAILSRTPVTAKKARRKKGL